MRPHICLALKTLIHLGAHFAPGKAYRQAIGVRHIVLLLLCESCVSQLILSFGLRVTDEQYRKGQRRTPFFVFGAPYPLGR